MGHPIPSAGVLRNDEVSRRFSTGFGLAISMTAQAERLGSSVKHRTSMHEVQGARGKGRPLSHARRYA